jgi:hypothetical protein
LSDLAAANGAALHAAMLEIFKILLASDVATREQCAAAMAAVASTIEQVAALSADGPMVKAMAAEFEATANVLLEGGAVGPVLAVIQGGKADEP